MANPSQNTNSRLKSKVLTSFAVSRVAIFFAGLILGWGILNVFGALKPSSFYSFSNIASAIASFGVIFKSDERLTVVSSDQSLNSGDLFTLTLDHVNKSSAEGEYTISYPCVPGFKLEHVYTDAAEELACGQKAVLGNASLTDVTLKTTLENGESLDVPMIIYFKGADGDTKKALYAQTLITVVNKNGSSLSSTVPSASTTQTGNVSNGTVATQKYNTPTLPKSNNTPSTATAGSFGQKAGVKTEKTFVYYSTGPTASDPQGVIDLEPRILEVGFVDKDTNVFTASSSPSANLRIAVRFEVINKGTKASGPWAFNAVLPTMPFHIYSGDSQQSLMPGNRIEFTIGFDSVERKNDGEFIVNVDPTSSVVESDESNNIVKIIIHPFF